MIAHQHLSSHFHIKPGNWIHVSLACFLFASWLSHELPHFSLSLGVALLCHPFVSQRVPYRSSFASSAFFEF